MCIVKVVNGAYRGKRDIEAVIAYAVSKSHCLCGLYGATGMRAGEAAEMAKSMKAVKNEFQKTEGRQVLHIVVSFDGKKEGWVTNEMAWRAGYRFVASEFYGYQAVFAVHDNTDVLHLHVVLNSVSYIDGKKCGIPVKASFSLAREMEGILHEYKGN